jgi:NtrC-family two-component system response regulator AlgB
MSRESHDGPGDEGDARVLDRSFDRFAASACDEQGQGPWADVPEWIGRSAHSRALLSAAAQVASSEAHVLLLGERGTGKGLLARLIHARSHRAGRTFLTVQCAALDRVALTAELFGSELSGQQGWRAPATGQLERAADGVLYLEEISALNPALQARLGRAMSERSFERLGSLERVPLRARIMAGAGIDVRRALAEGQFDERLFYEFGACLELAPLRHRTDDILPLASHFLEHYAGIHERRISGFSAAALDLLVKQEWPGNVRQLRHVVERAVVSAGGPIIDVADLATEITGWRDELPPADREDHSLAAVERRHIRRVLQMTGGRITEAADILGIHRNTLRRKMEQYGLTFQN